MSFSRTITQAVIGEQPDGDLKGLIGKASHALSQKRAALENSLAKAHQLLNQINPLTKTLVPSATDILTKAAIDIQSCLEEIEAAKKVFNGFRIQHGRLELPNHPSALGSVLACGVAVLIEAGVNAAFFLNAHLTAGATSALLTSTLISATNVVVCATAGFFAGRWTIWGNNAPEPNAPEYRTKRMCAKVFVGVFTGVMAFFHITVGAIRSQESLDKVFHSLPAYQEMLTTPESLFLIMAGVCMSLFSYHKGKYGFSDPYPQYGTIALKVEDAEALLMETFDDYADEIRGIFDEAIEAFQKNHQAHIKTINAYNKAVDQCHQDERGLQSAIQSAQTRLQTEVAQMMSLYQSVNHEIPVSQTEEELMALCDLSGELHYELPKHLVIPETHEFKTQCTNERETALNALSALLNEQIEED